MTVRELVSKILFRTDATGLKKVESNTRAAKRQMRAASRAAWSLKRDLRGLAIGFKGMIAAAIAGRVTKIFTEDFAKATDEAVKFSKAIGISLESYLGLTHAVRLSGGDIGDMNKALGQLQKRALEVTQGNKMQALAFNDLKVKVRDASGGLKKADVLLLEIAESFKRSVPESKRAGLAMQLLGRNGQKLVPMLMAGKKGITEMMAEAKKLGIVMSKEQAAVAERYNDEMLRAKSVLMGVRNIIALKLLPSISDNLHAFRKWATEGDNLRVWLKRAAIAAKILAAALALVAATKVGNALLVVAGSAKKAWFWMRALGLATMKTYAKFALIGVAIAAAVLAIQDLYVYAKGGESVIGPWFEQFAPAEKIRDILNSVGMAFRTIGKRAMDAGRAAIPIIIAGMQKLVPVGRAIIGLLVAVGLALQKVARRLWKEFGPALTELGEALVELFDELWPVIVQAAHMILEAWQALASAMIDLWRAMWPHIVSVARAGRQVLDSIISELRKAWVDLKPAIDEIGKALLSLWGVAKPVLSGILKASLKALKIFMQIAKAALPYLADAFKITFKVIATVITAAIKSLTFMVKTITKVIRAIKSAYDKMTSLLGLQGKVSLGAAIKAAGVPAPGGARPAAASVSQQVSVEGLSVNVSGSANMSPDELKSAVDEGVKRGIQKVLDETAVSFSGVFG